MIYVLDACAFLAFLRGEPGEEVIADLLKGTAHECFLHAVNLIEIRYDIVRSAGASAADAFVDSLLAAGLTVRTDLDEEFCHHVSELKAGGGVSLADCFAIALANRLEGEVVTSDHKEFDPLVARGVVRARFIR